MHMCGSCAYVAHTRSHRACTCGADHTRSCTHGTRTHTVTCVRVHEPREPTQGAHTRTHARARTGLPCTSAHTQSSHTHACTHRARTHMRTHRARTHVRAHTELTQTCVRGVRGPARRGWSSGHASGAPQTRRKGCHLSHHGTPHREAGPRAMFPTCPPRGPAHRGALAHRGAMPMNLFPTCPPRGPAHRGALAHRGAMPMNSFPTCPPRGPAH